MTSSTDRWFDWLSGGRDANDSAARVRALAMLIPIRDEVLRLAELSPGAVVLDVGAGQGLLAFEAAHLVGPSGHVVFSDISPHLVAEARSGSEALGVRDRMSFIEADATNLEQIGDASIDVIVIRSVLIYVDDREQAFREFARVLRPDGRVVCFEPVAAFFRASEYAARGEFFGWDMTDIAELARTVVEYYEPSEAPESPLLTLSPEKLATAAERAGFEDVSLTLVARTTREVAGDDTDVKARLYGRPNPTVLSPAEAAKSLLAADQAAQFTARYADAIRRGEGRRREASLMLVARRRTS